uniref:Uncharacterized protein n=1 Tax=Brassica oleracea TaxID=3712 RepID=A0A3P6DBA4_BRAOL|nr:unnamed protein product [Brassica oleracea]
MTSVPGTDSLAWTDEQTRFYLQLRIEEKLKGNDRKQNVNEAGRQSIIDKFYDAYGERHPWRKFGIKHATCKTQCTKYKRLINKRTGLGFDAYGFIEMSDDWWNELFKKLDVMDNNVWYLIVLLGVWEFLLGINVLLGVWELLGSQAIF